MQFGERGKRDRPANWEIDQKTLQYKQNPDKDKQIEKDSPQKISQRKFYKIKGIHSEDKEVSDSKPKFTLFGNLSDSATKNQTKQKNGEHNSQEKNIEKDKKDPNAHEQKNEKQQNQQNQKQEQKKSLFNLFSFPNTNFGTGLSSNAGGNGIGIFTSSDPKEGGIFSKNNAFMKKDSKDEPKSTTTNNIFGTNQSIFNFTSNGVPPIKKQTNNTFNLGGNDGNDSGDSQQLQKDQKKQIDPSKSTGTYKYQSEDVILLQKKLLKFKKDQGTLIQNTQIVVQQQKQKKTTWLTVRLQATKNSILTALLVEGKCEVKKMGAKQQNVMLSVVVIKDNHPERCVLKCQFQKAEDGRQFMRVIGGIIGCADKGEHKGADQGKQHNQQKGENGQHQGEKKQ